MSVSDACVFVKCCVYAVQLANSKHGNREPAQIKSTDALPREIYEMLKKSTNQEPKPKRNDEVYYCLRLCVCVCVYDKE